MPTTQQLRELRASTWEQMKALIEKPERSAEDNQTYDRLEKEYDRLDGDIERAERHEVRAKANETVDRKGVVPPADQAAGPSDEAYNTAFRNFLRQGVNELNPDERALMRSRFEQFKNAAGVGTGAAGGYLVPPEFRQTLIEQMTFVAAMRQYAEVITTDTGANLPWPTVDDTGQEGAILGENTQISEQDVTFGQASLDSYMYTSKLVRVSLQLLNDNAFNLNSWLPKALGQRVGRIQNRHFTVGTGTAQPDGIMTSATVGVTGTGSFAGVGGAVTYANLIDLIDSIDPSYINSNSRFMLNQTVRKSIRKLVDGQNRPLWEPSLQVGQPDSLLGYPVALNNYIATPAQNAKTILFGDIAAAYLIRDVSDLAVMRLVERYADFLQVGFFAFQRSDGTLQNASAAKVFQMTPTA